jgi:hypothetical protein
MVDTERDLVERDNDDPAKHAEVASRRGEPGTEGRLLAFVFPTRTSRTKFTKTLSLRNRLQFIPNQDRVTIGV